jgi:hypothetical protein
MKYSLRSLSAPYWLFMGQSGGILIVEFGKLRSCPK